MEEYKQVQQYLDSFINYERSPGFNYRRSLKLERVKAFLTAAAIPYQKLKVIHIAGTKGKGSTAHFCADLLAGAGQRAGLYTSPHFLDFRERIVIKKPETRVQKPEEKEEKLIDRVRTQMIAKQDVVRIVKELKPWLEKLKDSALGRLSFFEIYTGIAFKYFIEQEVDFVVLETGMGGRRDATNVVIPLVSIITNIGYDHTDKLGRRLVDIAYEKAGIIKRGAPVVSSAQAPVVLPVLRKKCRAARADLFVYGRDFRNDAVRLAKNHTTFNFCFNRTVLKNLRISLKGKRQTENAALSLAAVSLLQERGLLSAAANLGGAFARTHLAARFEIVKKNPLVIMDMAHNVSSFSVLRDNLKTYFPLKKRIILIFAVSQDKDVKKMLKIIDYSYLILTGFNNPRCLPPLAVKERCKLKNALFAGNVKEAFKLAGKLYNRKSLILIAGSVFLVSEAKKMLKMHDGHGKL